LLDEYFFRETENKNMTAERNISVRWKQDLKKHCFSTFEILMMIC